MTFTIEDFVRKCEYYMKNLMFPKFEATMINKGNNLKSQLITFLQTKQAEYNHF